MATVEQRYQAATDYVKRAIRSVETSGGSSLSSILPAVLATEIYADQLKTETAKSDLAAIEARWLRAASDMDRARIARDAELLADRVEENVPGAPADWKRTNLYPGEAGHTTPSTTYAAHATHQAHDAWGWLKGKTSSVASEAKSIGKLILIGGGVLLGIKAVSYVGERERRKPKVTRDPRRALNASLEHAASKTRRKVPL